MPPQLHLDPDRLHTHARRLTAVLDGLVPLPDVDSETRSALASTATGAAALTELDRITAVVDRAARELSALTAALHETAAAAVDADHEAAAVFAALHPAQP